MMAREAKGKIPADDQALFHKLPFSVISTVQALAKRVMVIIHGTSLGAASSPPISNFGVRNVRTLTSHLSPFCRA